MSEISEHFNICNEEYNKLVKSGISDSDLLRNIKTFHGTWEKPISSMGLCYYIDDLGNFNKGNLKHQRIAKAIFNSLNSRNKIEILEYLDWHDDGEPEDIIEDDEDDED